MTIINVQDNEWLENVRQNCPQMIEWERETWLGDIEIGLNHRTIVTARYDINDEKGYYCHYLFEFDGTVTALEFGQYLYVIV